ncbi:MAG: PIN domain protein [bacterium ADurb.Bin363]|nr:MAG: PIN domain protein [bacterium ADurb.Bin363]
MLRVVLDTNVFVSAFLTGGIAEEVIRKWQKGKITLITTKEILLEIIGVLYRLQVSEYHIKRLIRLIHQKAKIVKPNFKVEICRDPMDNKFIECAIKGNAKVIITADKDLLIIGEYKNIIILKAKEFLEKFDKLE